MKSLVLLSSILVGLSAFSAATAQDFYPDFALVVQLPNYEAFLTNLGDRPIRVDGYTISSAAGSLNPAGWESMDAAGPEIVAALGPGADQFIVANPSASSLAELNPASSATWQPGQRWSLGFPFRSDDPNFVVDAVFHFASPDGLVLTGGTVVPPGELGLASVIVVPEPSAVAVVLPAAWLVVTCRTRKKSATAVRQWRTP
jgi:hypothetical protein